MSDYPALIERLDRHWIMHRYQTGDPATPEEIAQDCHSAADAIRELLKELQEAVKHGKYFADTAIRLARE